VADTLGLLEEARQLAKDLGKQDDGGFSVTAWSLFHAGIPVY
jgi:hypothetical protein